MCNPSVPASAAAPVALLACSVFEHEVALLTRDAGHIRELRWFEIGLHDQPDRLRTTLQAHIDAVDARDDIAAIVLAYGLCGRGTVGLRAHRHPLVITRAHDCITLFMGGRETYAAHQRRCPTCYYYTPGWSRAHRVPGPERLAHLRTEYAGKFEPEDVEFLLETEQAQWSLYDTAAWIDLDTPGAAEGEACAAACARSLGWKFQRLRGDPSLLRDLLWGRWDEDRFQVIPPGLEIAHLADERIVGARPARPA